jgi:small subunit ribosomal protein S20
MLKRRSAMKRVRQNEKRRLRNKMNKSALRTAMRKFAEAVKEGPEKARSALPTAFRALDVAARKGAIPRKRADRKKARLALMAAKAATSTQASTSKPAEVSAQTQG